jgi:hypothetical protein
MSKRFALSRGKGVNGFDNPSEALHWILGAFVGRILGRA